MTSVLRSIHRVIFRTKHPSISAPPTHFQKYVENFKIKFPGNWTKTLISPESPWFTESLPIFWNKKNAHPKKNMAISNPGIQPIYYGYWVWMMRIGSFGHAVRALRLNCRRIVTQTKILYFAKWYDFILYFEKPKNLFSLQWYLPEDINRHWKMNR